MTQVADDPLQAGREAAARGAYAEAYELLRSAADLTAHDVERLAEAAYWTQRLEEAMAARERAYNAYLGEGAKADAARMALLISGDYFGKNQPAVSRGWYLKAERLLAGSEESRVHALLAFMKAAVAFMDGKFAEGAPELERALQIAAREDDRNVLAMALVMKGRGLVLQGEVEEGMKLLDEATSAAVSGELEPFATGFVYCCTITSCHGIGDIRRAAEWTEEANRWCESKEISGFPGACRIHHASITRLRGDWTAAEAQARRACAEVGGYDTWTTGAGFYEIGEIHRRRGEFADAEAAYDKAKEWSRDPQPGRALLRLAQGKVDEALVGIRRSLSSTSDPVSRIRRLPALVEIAVEAGQIGEARKAAEELETLADGFKLEGRRPLAFEASIHLAWGQIRVAEGDVEDAVAELERAIAAWQEIRAPYEVAQARLLLGLALRRQGDEAGARDEFRAACLVFDDLKAALDQQRTRELLGESETRRTFMFTDIVDSTKLAEALGEAKWKKALGWHDRELRERIEGAGGEVIKQTGDGYFAAFDSAKAALTAAVEIQRAIDGHDGFAPDVRIGVHSGEAFLRSEDDYAGQGVNIAARVGALASGGEILVSRDSIDGAPFPVSEVRTEELKGVEESVELVAVDWR